MESRNLLWFSWTDITRSFKETMRFAKILFDDNKKYIRIY
jgi:hypothetical protein